MEYITGRQNPLLQQVRKLQSSRSFRYESRMFAAEGTKLYEEARKWFPGLHTVVLREGVEADVPPGVRAVTVPAGLFQSLSSQESPQGLLFLCRMPEPEPLRICGGTLILDGIQDPGNLGTILRTADALELPVVLSEGCADPYSDKTVRASMGAVFRRTPVQASRQEIRQTCEACGIPLLATAMSEDARDLRRASLRSAALVIGSEGRGVCAEFMECAAGKIIIPMNPHCESLNAAVAAAIVMWQMKCEI